MSKQGKDDWNPHDPSEPSTSSGYRKPYSRFSEHEKRHSSGKKKEKLKFVSKTSGSEYDTDASTSSYSRQYDSQQVEVKSESMEVKSEPVEVKSESMEVESESTDIKSEDGGGDAASISEGTSTQGRKKETIFVSRPKSLTNKKGMSGQQVVVQSNHFRMPTVPDWNLRLFRVDFEPEETRNVVRKGMLKLHKEKVGSYIFDGTVLYAVTQLPDKAELISKRKSDDAQIKITIRFIRIVSPEEPQYIVFFNIVMRKCLEHLQLQMVSRCFYDARNKEIIFPFKLELWPGYDTSIRRYEYEVMMGVEISYKIIRQETLMHILTESYESSDFKLTFSNAVIGLMVLTSYNNHVYRVEDVDFNVTPSSTFPMKSGIEISYMEYYQTKYRIRITNPTQPLLVVRTRPKAKNLGKGDLVYLIPELCRPVGLTDKMKEQFPLMRELATRTRLSPDARIEKLMRFNHRLRGEDKVIRELSDWHMKLDKFLVDVPARILPSEKLTFGRNVTINSGHGDWTREMQRAPLLISKHLKNWVVIVTNRGHYALQGFLDKLYRVSHGLAFRIEQPQICTIPEDSGSTYINCLERILSKKIPDLVFCVVSNSRTDRYTAIKKKCCLDRPVVSQVILQKNLDSKNSMTVATKVAIQMNCKLGGAPWLIQMPYKGIMAIGIDTCRDSNTKGKEYMAMVATVNQMLTQYYSDVSLFHNHEELGERLCEGVRKAVNMYRYLNQALPMYLLIYRDGVSEGQLSQVYENETKSLKKLLEELYYGPNFKMTFVIVSRNNLRLFYNKRNPPTGTIVDDVVTCPLKYDFYLVSQQIRQGTISPTAYNVISDNSGLQPDMIQLMTFKLTHMYYNCSSTVRAPAPCHYAKKLSFLVARILHRPPGTQLQNQLFFL